MPGYPVERGEETESHETSLPSLHQVLGDILVSPSSSSHPPSGRTNYDERDTRRHGRKRDYRQLHTSHLDRLSMPAMSPSSSHPSPQKSDHPNPQSSVARASGYSFDLFNVTLAGNLVHQKSSAQDNLDEARRVRTSSSSDLVRKYVCPECGKRFAKPSTLRNHSMTHTGEKPFACEHPGCNKRFTMANNMQRHMKTHATGSAFETETV